MLHEDNEWRKASFSNNNGTCVEVRYNGKRVQVRDTKDSGTGFRLEFTKPEWDAFVEGVKADEFTIA